MIRPAMIRHRVRVASVLLWMATASIASVAAAATPDPGSVAQLMRLFAYDAVAEAMAKTALESPMAGRWTPEQKQCMGTMLRVGVSMTFESKLAAALGSEAHAQAWVAFSKTSAGARMFELAHEQPRSAEVEMAFPSDELVSSRFTPADAEAIREFMRSPAGRLTGKLGSLGPTYEETLRIVAISQGRCLPPTEPARAPAAPTTPAPAKGG